MPLFSLVIPTLQRSDTLRHALATLIEQTYGDFEIIVQNNGGDPATESLVRGLNDPRIRHFSSDTILRMAENWEAALANCRGEFVVFIGDDDGMFPDACEVAAQILERTGVEILSWLPFCYYWPNYVQRESRNRLIALVNQQFYVQMFASEERLQRFYRFTIDYSHLPMIYNSFVRRSVVERAKKKAGRYFLGNAPDVTSGIMNAAQESKFAQLSSPLSITGLSHHSSGHNMFVAPRGHIPASRIERDLGVFRIDERLVSSDSLQIFIANDMLIARDLLFPHHPRIRFDYHGLVGAMAAAINDRPGLYDEMLAQIHALAARYSVDLAGVALPPKLASASALASGIEIVDRNRMRFVIDGDKAGFASVADAVRYMAPLVPRAEYGRPIEIREMHGPGPVAVRSDEVIRFGLDGKGPSSLAAGWGQVEEWGTWSVSKRASLRLLLDPAPLEPLNVAVYYRAFLHESHPRLDVACRVKERLIDAWTCIASPGRRSLIIPAEAIAVDGTLELEFMISNPRSPADLGLSADTRLLGIGLQELRFGIDSREADVVATPDPLPSTAMGIVSRDPAESGDEDGNVVASGSRGP